MHIICVICSELLIPSEEVYNTSCGHIFHHKCLTKWLERSNTCPQCRVQTTTKTIHRIYFNISNNDSFTLDPVTLQSKNDNLTFRLNIKDTEITGLKKEISEFKKQIDGLKQEVRNCEVEISSKKSAIYAFKEQIEFYKQLCADVESKNKQLENLQSEVAKLKNIQTLINASVDELDSAMQMAYTTRDPTTLLTYISVMKREMTDNFNKRRVLREKVKTLQQELIKVTAERNALSEERKKRMELEDIWLKQENEKIMLQTKLHDMHLAMCNCVCNKVPEEIQKCLENCKEHNIKETSDLEVKNSDSPETLRAQADSSCIIITNSPNTENTPLNLQSQGFFSMTRSKIKKSNNAKVPSILAKRPKVIQIDQEIVGNTMSFDGFGGHAKRDGFPTMLPSSRLKRRREEINLTKPKLGVFNNKKLESRR